MMGCFTHILCCECTGGPTALRYIDVPSPDRRLEINRPPRPVNESHGMRTLHTFARAHPRQDPVVVSSGRTR